MKSISVRIETRAGLDRIRSNYRHDFRQGRIPKYVDKSLSHENTVYQAEAYSCKPGGLIAEHKRRFKGRMTKRTAAIVRFIITLSVEAQELVRSLPTKRQNQLFVHVAKRCAKHLDLPLSTLAVHRDETAPHAHGMMLNSTFSEGKSYRGGKRDMQKLQDVAAEACKELGLEIERGTPKAERIRAGEKKEKWAHRSVKELHQELVGEINGLKRENAQLREENARLKRRLRGLRSGQVVGG